MLAMLADDLGYYDTAIHNPASPTPKIAGLAQGGLTLDRHYVFRYCSPSRRSFLTGRLPVHITTVQPDGDRFCSDFTPLATQILSEKLSAVGYQCHFVGKGHLGYQTTDHMPVQRGFVSHIGYLDGAESYSHGGGSADPTKGSHDLWRDDAPAIGDVRGMTYSADFYSREAVGVIERHAEEARGHGAYPASAAPPLFMYLSIQNVHMPYTLPPPWQVRQYPAMGAEFHTYANMLAMLDGVVGNVTDALRRHGMWEDSLILFFSDNGGTGKYGNNFPLRGHKHDPWEGGVRSLAFLAGGSLPHSMRGTRSSALVHVSDWYPTLCLLAGASPINDANISGRVRPIDGVDVWPLLTGLNNTHPRPVTVITEASAVEVEGGRGTRVDAAGRAAPALWKLVTLAGQSNYYDEAGQQINGTDMPCLSARQPDPPQPGRTDPLVNGPAAHEAQACPVCNASLPCLYELVSDPQERHNRASEPGMEARIERLARSIERANADAYVSGSLDPQTLSVHYEEINATALWRGFLGPCYVRRASELF
jgi:arylsulfatase A-like enzyme